MRSWRTGSLLVDYGISCSAGIANTDLSWQSFLTLCYRNDVCISRLCRRISLLFNFGVRNNLHIPTFMRTFLKNDVKPFEHLVFFYKILFYIYKPRIKLNGYQKYVENYMRLMLKFFLIIIELLAAILSTVLLTVIITVHSIILSLKRYIFNVRRLCW